MKRVVVTTCGLKRKGKSGSYEGGRTIVKISSPIKVKALEKKTVGKRKVGGSRTLLIRPRGKVLHQLGACLHYSSALVLRKGGKRGRKGGILFYGWGGKRERSYPRRERGSPYTGVSEVPIRVSNENSGKEQSFRFCKKSSFRKESKLKKGPGLSGGRRERNIDTRSAESPRLKKPS